MVLRLFVYLFCFCFEIHLDSILDLFYEKTKQKNNKQIKNFTTNQAKQKQKHDEIN